MAHDGSDDDKDWDQLVSGLAEALAAAAAAAAAEAAENPAPSDGSQYDIKDPPWGLDYLLERIEEALAEVEAAETPDAKAMWREVLADYKYDLRVAHGIEL
jgi:hypothetical protein